MDIMTGIELYKKHTPCITLFVYHGLEDFFTTPLRSVCIGTSIIYAELKNVLKGSLSKHALLWKVIMTVDT